MPKKSDFSKASSKRGTKRQSLNLFSAQIESFPPLDLQKQHYLSSCIHYQLQSCKRDSFCPKDCNCYASPLDVRRYKTEKSEKHLFCGDQKNCVYADRCTLRSCEEISSPDPEIYSTTVEEVLTSVESLRKDKRHVQVCPTRLKNARESKKLTLDQVERLSWVSGAWISQCETATENGTYRKTRIEKSLCYFLAALYDVSPSYLMGLTNKKNLDLYAKEYHYVKKDLKNTVTAKNSTSNAPESDTIIETVSPAMVPLSTKMIAGLDACTRLTAMLDAEIQKRCGEPTANEHDNTRILNKKHPEVRNLEKYMELIQLGKYLYFSDLPGQVKNELCIYIEGLMEHLSSK